MIFPQDRVEPVCALGPVQASDLLDKGRAGDVDSLAAWSVYAIHRRLLKLGASKFAALHHTKNLVDSVEIEVLMRS